MKNKFLYLWVISSFAFGQDLGTWNTLNFNFSATTKWSFFAETQLRSLKFYQDFHYYEFKGGAQLKLKNISITSGFGSYNTYSAGGNFENPILQREIRTWLQANLKNKLSFGEIEHRYRAEQRFTNNGYRNRFRYRIGYKIPFDLYKKENLKWHLQAWNEVFFTNNEPFFERNRAFIGGGLDLNKNMAIQTGYIHQFDYKINDEIGRDFFAITLFYALDKNYVKEID
jgi:Protein of unknown function (DUF2490)